MTQRQHRSAKATPAVGGAIRRAQHHTRAYARPGWRCKVGGGWHLGRSPREGNALRPDGDCIEIGRLLPLFIGAIPHLKPAQWAVGSGAVGSGAMCSGSICGGVICGGAVGWSLRRACQLVIPSGEMALLTAWYQPRFCPSSSRFPMFHVPPGAYHIITFGMPTISYTPRSVITRNCTRRYSPSLSCSRLFGVGPWMITPAVDETAMHFTSRASFHRFSAPLHTDHAPLMSCGSWASDLTWSQPRA